MAGLLIVVSGIGVVMIMASEGPMNVTPFKLGMANALVFHVTNQKVMLANIGSQSGYWKTD